MSEYEDKDDQQLLAQLNVLKSRVRNLKEINSDLCDQLRKAELRSRIAISVAVGATAGLATSLLF